MKPPIRLRIIAALAIFAALSLTAFIGCDHLQSVKPSITNNNGDLGGSIEVVFKDAKGVQKSVTVPRVTGTSRGYDAAGNFVTLGTLKGYAIAAYQNGQSSRQVADTYRLGEFDRQTVETVVLALAKAGATTFNP